jgi:hypothetical protein
VRAFTRCLLLLGALLPPSLATQEAPPPNAKELVISGQPTAVQVPPFGFWGHSACDTGGNSYFHPGEFNSPHLVKISASTGEGRALRPKDDGAEQFSAFAVSPNGTVWLKLESRGFSVVSFSSNGTPSSPTQLETPAGLLSVPEFAVNDDGVIFFRGYFKPSAKAEGRAKMYTALFGPSGTLLRELRDEDAGDISSLETTGWSGYVTAAADGYFYQLQGESIRVLNSTGKLLRTIRYKKSDAKLTPIRVAISGGLIAIWLTKEDAKGMLSFHYDLIDADTGEARGNYLPPKELPSWESLCFARTEGFTFLNKSGDHLSLARAPLP